MEYFDYNNTRKRFNSSKWELDIEEFLEESEKRERERIEAELECISRQLEKRGQIRDENVDELESKLNWYIDRLEELYARSLGNECRKDKNELKKKIEEFYKEIRTEERGHWRDTQKLQQERRELLRELDELNEDLLDLI